MAVRAQEPQGMPPVPVVGGYRLERVVSDEPAFHVLYEGFDAQSGEPVSVKVYAIASDRGVARRFVRAAQQRAEVVHPHLLAIHGASEWEGRLVLATEPSELPTLADRLRDDPPGRRESIEILSQVADALDAASAAGIVDHELSPSSILLDPVRGALLGDLGIAVSLTEGLPPWAQPFPRYISPEVARGEAAEPGSNVYSLACILLECVTGAPPFDGSLQLIAYSHAAENPPTPSDRDPELGEGFDAVMKVALSKSPRDRFGSAGELIDAAANVLGVGPAPTPDRLSERQRRARIQGAFSAPRRLRPALIALALVPAIAIAGYLAGDSAESPRSEAAPARPSPELVAAARSIDGTVARLDGDLRTGRARLDSARTAAGQARAAEGLARVYRTALAEVMVVNAVRGVDPSDLARPMLAASNGYDQLARAAQEGDPDAFAAARRDIAAAESALRAELAAL